MNTFLIVVLVLAIINIAVIRFYKIKDPLVISIVMIFGFILMFLRLLEVFYEKIVNDEE